MAAAATEKQALGRLLSGATWLALQFLLQIILSLWSIRLIVDALGPAGAGAYRFAMGFGVFQFLFEFGAGSALQRQLSDAWTRGDRARVDRTIACGMSFYAATSLVQAAALLGVAHLAVPHAEFDPASQRLVVRLLWLQALTAPCFGFAAVVSCMLQVARRYDLVARCELAITLLRFAVLVAGVRAGVDFFWVAAAQTAAILIPRAGPALWVMVRELGYVPHFRGAGRADFEALGRFSFYVALIQVGSVLTDRVDTAILGFVLAQPGRPIAVYDVVSKPYLLLSQAGMMLISMVIPAVAGLAAAGDGRGLERVKYDGSRLHIGVLLPVGLLAWLYAGPFLSLWIGDRLGGDAARMAPLLRLFLVAAIPLLLGVPVQMAIGLDRIRAIAVAALAGSLVNLLLSCYLTARLGVSGVIWGTVLTTMVSNLLVPGLVVWRALAIDPRTYLGRTLGAPAAGAAALIASTWALHHLLPVASLGAAPRARGLLLILHLAVGTFAYLGGYVSVPAGRGDLAWSAAGLRRGRFGRVRPGAPDHGRAIEDRTDFATGLVLPPENEASNPESRAH
jgi:O-antigen/teichoic acid export membrane protein